jgi:hypothetical protein
MTSSIHLPVNISLSAGLFRQRACTRSLPSLQSSSVKQPYACPLFLLAPSGRSGYLRDSIVKKIA